MFNPDTAPGGGSYFLPSFEAAAQSLHVTPIIAPVHDETGIEETITMLASQQGEDRSPCPMGLWLSIAQRSYHL